MYRDRNDLIQEKISGPRLEMVTSRTQSLFRTALRKIAKDLKHAIAQRELTSNDAAANATTLVWLINSFLTAPNDASRIMVNESIQKLRCPVTVRDFKTFALRQCGLGDNGTLADVSDAHMQFWIKLNALGSRNLSVNDLTVIPDIDATVILTDTERLDLQDELESLST